MGGCNWGNKEFSVPVKEDKIVAICTKCQTAIPESSLGYKLNGDTVCKQCFDNIPSRLQTGEGAPGVIDHAWVSKETWEHIDPTNPHMRVDSKKQLIMECAKRGLMPKAFLKPRSQGKGFEVR